MRWLAGLMCVLGLLPRPSAAEAQSPQRPVVLQVRLEDEAITPISARFLQGAIRQAEQQRATCLIIVLDTPGGLVDSTRRIVKDMLSSEVPIVVYVAPSGARAASAGVFITLAAHVAAMAPGTHIGAAHPVQIGGLPGSAPEKDERKGAGSVSPLEEKLVNDTVAWARTLAERRGRNTELAARMVKESISLPNREAVQEKIVDFQADSLSQLLEKLHNHRVQLSPTAPPVHLRTRDAEVRTIEMWWGDRVLGVLSNPTVAFLLLMLGFYAILFELSAPGWGVAGTLGILCLVLGFFGLAVLPINYVGLALLVLALALFVAEAFVVSHGLLTVGGVVCLVLGGLMLVESAPGFERVSLMVLVPVAVATAAVSFFLIGNIVRTHRGRVQTGGEALMRASAVALEDFTPRQDGYAGLVQTHGEWWKARSRNPVSAGQTLEVIDRQGLTLEVSDQQSKPITDN